MKKLFALLLLAALAFSLAACASDPEPADDPGDFYDPAQFISFDESSVKGTLEALTVTLNNGSNVDISVSGSVQIWQMRGEDWGHTQQTNIVGTVVPKGGSAPLTFNLSAFTGRVSVAVTYTWVDGNGALRTGEAAFAISLASDSPAPLPDDPSSGDRDVKTTPIADLTESEGKTLADYLFATYVPHCFGVFEDPSQLTSATLWASVDALNRNVDGDTSNACFTPEDAQKKVARYYPGATLVPEDVRLYNKQTGLFASAPSQIQKYKFLSYEIQGDAIVIYYEDIPEDTDQAPGQYATTLKNSTESGYFAFLSTVRVGAVG